MTENEQGKWQSGFYVPASKATDSIDPHYVPVAAFFDTIMRKTGSCRAMVVDLGCYRGDLVRELKSRGYNAHGCDLHAAWPEGASEFRLIQASPYRLPFDDESADVLISMSVLEHARNLPELWAEIRRVLKPGGVSFHTFPSRWFLPLEPHIKVPLANYFWPHFPKWWFKLWARLGVRSANQRGYSVDEVIADNLMNMSESFHYISNRAHARIAREVMGHCDWPMELFIEYMPGRGPELLRKLPLKSLTGFFLREFRYAFMMTRKV